MQIIADAHGNVIHLGERECSLQRRHQKVIEEAPSPLLDAATRERIGAAACDAARSVGYRGAGTVEFIVSANAPDEFFFMEMNTRLQVEHPVTEMVTGVDLVECQVRIAAGEELPIAQDEVSMRGHAIEARVYAEDPARGFLPTGGTVLALSEPSGEGVRVDSGLRPGTVVGGNYDPMLSKIIAWAPTRDAALTRLDTALAETRVDGVGTNLDFCRFLLAQPRVRSGELDTNLLDQLVADDGGGAGYAPPSVPAAAFAAACQAIESAQEPSGARGHAGFDNGRGWRLGGPAEFVARFEAGAASPVVARLRADDPERLLPGALGLNRSGEVDAAAEEEFEVYVLGGPSEFRVTCDSVTTDFATTLQRDPGGEVRAVWVSGGAGSWTLQLLPTRVPRDGVDASSNLAITSPMPGSVVAVHVSEGDEVAEGDPVLAIEAMKMEHTLRAQATGKVRLKVARGEQVGADAVLAVIDNEEEPHK